MSEPAYLTKVTRPDERCDRVAYFCSTATGEAGHDEALRWLHRNKPHGWGLATRHGYSLEREPVADEVVWPHDRGAYGAPCHIPQERS